MKYKLCSLNDLFGSHIGIQIERRKIKERSRHSENQAYWIEPEPTKLDERKEIFDDLKILQKNARTHNVPTGDQHVIINDCILRNVNYIINQKKKCFGIIFHSFSVSLQSFSCQIHTDEMNRTSQTAWLGITNSFIWLNR